MHARLSSTLRQAFTLVELLVVIVILAMLMGLGLYGATVAMNKAKVTAVIVEMEQISAAIDSLKGDIGAYPPCMGALLTTSTGYSATTMVDRATRMDNFMKRYYPRSTVSYSSLQTLLGSSLYLYKYKNSSGTIGILNIATLDQAEAIVFWLGGFPAPVDTTGNPLCSRKLIGFHMDPSNPFKLDTYSAANPGLFIQSRTNSRFTFQEDRLVDTDGDGWLEYVPKLSGSVEVTPPYVYFDASLYANWRNLTSTCSFFTFPTLKSDPPYNALTAGLRSSWGVTSPYAATVTSNNITWINPTSFQIHCAGLDLLYGNTTTPVQRVPMFPIGTTYRGTASGFLDPEEQDNLTNFANQTIGDAAAGS